MRKDFPLRLLMPYVGFYAAQAIFGTYLNLYLNDAGFSKTQMGTVTSVSTLLVLLTQSFWGYASDRAKSKNNVITVLLAGCCITILGFYLGMNFYYILFLNSLFCFFYNPIPPLIDNMSLETLESTRSRFDFGHIRMGGTIGYALGVLIAGQLMQDNYQRIFYMICILMVFSLISVRRVPSVQGHRRKQKNSFKVLFSDKKIFCFIFLNFIFSLGMVIYYSYYPLYFTSIGGNSSAVGTLMFVTAASEIPFWLITGKLTEKLGYSRVMILSAVVTGFRWLALYFVTNPVLAILVNLSHGFCFVTLNYGIVTYINKNIPKDLRATGQSMNNMLTTIFSRVIGGVVIGYLSDIFGIQSMLLFSSIASFAGACIFAVCFRAISRSDLGAVDIEQ